MEKHKNYMSILFINVGILGNADADFMREIAKKNHVEDLPSILILDSKGKYVNMIPGEFVEEDIEKEIDKIIR